MPLTQVSGGGLADDSVSAAKIATGAVTVADIPDGEITHLKLAADCVDGDNIADDVVLGGNPTTTTQSASNNSTRIATTAYVDTAVGNLSQDSMTEGNTKAEVVDTGSDGHFKVETEGTERLRVIADGKVGIGTTTPTCELDITGTGAVQVPVGTTEQRPTANADNNGMLRYNSTTNQFEGCINGSFAAIAAASLDVIAVGSISGTPGIGETLTAGNPTVVGGDGTYSFSYQWQVAASGSTSFSAISGATNSTLTVASTYNSNAAIGQQIRCVVTASDGATPAATSAGVITAAVTVARTRQSPTWNAGKLYRFTPDSTTGSVSSHTQTQITINSSTSTKAVSWGLGGSPMAMWAVTEDGEVWSHTAHATSSSNNNLGTHRSYLERSGRTIVQCVTHGGWSGNYIYVLYDNGSIYYTPNSTTSIDEIWSDSNAASNPCKTLWGCQFYSSSTGGAVFEDGRIMLFQGHNARTNIAGYSGTIHTLINPMPSGVKCLDAVATGTQEAHPTHRDTKALLLLGDDGDVYSVGDNTYAVGTVTSGNINTTNGAAKASDFGDIIAIGGNQGNDGSWAGGGSYAGDKSAWILRSNGTVYYVGDGDTSWQQLGSDTDYLTIPWLNQQSNCGAFSTSANTMKWGHHDLDAGDVTISTDQPSNWDAAFSKIGSCSTSNGFADMYCIIPD